MLICWSARVPRGHRGTRCRSPTTGRATGTRRVRSRHRAALQLDGHLCRRHLRRCVRPKQLDRSIPTFPSDGHFYLRGVSRWRHGRRQLSDWIIRHRPRRRRRLVPFVWHHIQHFMCRPRLPNEERSARHGAGPCRLDLGPGDVLRHRGRCFR